MLNWITLGYPDRPNRQALAGEPVSAEQYKVLETLECHIAHFCRLPSFARNDLGRFGEKFAALFGASQELPAAVEVDLDVLLHEISNSFDSYAKYEAPHFVDRKQQDTEQDPEFTPKVVKLPNTSNKRVIASENQLGLSDLDLKVLNEQGIRSKCLMHSSIKPKASMGLSSWILYKQLEKEFFGKS